VTEATEKAAATNHEKDDDDDDAILPSASSQSTATATTSMATNTSTFPSRLHYMLAELERDGMDHIVSWCSHGRAFMVHKQDQFVELVLPL
jgi:HSF-type DNA-binding